MTTLDTSFVRQAIKTAAFAATVLIGSISFSFAQDFEAFERRLGEAVADGEISLDQAHMLINVLRESASGEHEHDEHEHGHHEHHEHDDHEHEHEHHEHHNHGHHDEAIHDYVEALEEVGVERERIEPAMDAARHISEAMAQLGDRFRLNEDIERRLVRGIGLNGEQVRMVIGIAERMAHRHDKHHEEDDLEIKKREYAEIVDRIEMAVEEGELSREEGKRKAIEIRKKMFRGGKDTDKEEDERLMKRVNRIKIATERGDMSPAEARMKMVEVRLRAAVERGDLSEEEAKQKLLQLKTDRPLRKDDAADEEAADDRMKSIRRRIRSAIERGDLTVEEAREKLRKLKEKYSDDQ